MKRMLVGVAALIALAIAGTACAGSQDDHRPGTGDRAQATQPARSTGTASTTPQRREPPVDVCALLDVSVLRAKGIAARTNYQATDGGLIPSDSCPVFPDQKGTVGSLGDLRVAMTPTTPAAFRRARARLHGTPLAGIADDAFVTVARVGGRRDAVYARRGDTVVSIVRAAAIGQREQLALVREALRRLPAQVPFQPRAWPAECDRLGQDAAAALLRGPIRATRGWVRDDNIACDLYAAPGHLEIYLRQQPSTLQTERLRRLTGISGATAAFVDPGNKQGFVLVGDREAFIVVWSPEDDLRGLITGPFERVGPELRALFADVAHALAA